MSYVETVFHLNEPALGYDATQTALQSMATFSTVVPNASEGRFFGGERCTFAMGSDIVDAGIFNDPSVEELRHAACTAAKSFTASELALLGKCHRHNVGGLSTPNNDSDETPLVALFNIVQESRALHQAREYRRSTVQAASQFNYLEFVSPECTPEMGISCYEDDYTQGPACAMACAAGTAYRNYLLRPRDYENSCVEKEEKEMRRRGQRRDCQCNGLAGVAQLLDSADLEAYFTVRNGYTESSEERLKRLNQRLQQGQGSDSGLDDAIIKRIRVGVQHRSRVTDSYEADCEVTQVYCSAISVGYSAVSSSLWEPLARLVLKAAYEATFWVGVINVLECFREWLNTSSELKGSMSACISSLSKAIPPVMLTKVGGGVFANDKAWIQDAILHAISCLHRHCGVVPLRVYIVHYGGVEPTYGPFSLSAYASYTLKQSAEPEPEPEPEPAEVLEDTAAPITTTIDIDMCQDVHRVDADAIVAVFTWKVMMSHEAPMPEGTLNRLITNSSGGIPFQKRLHGELQRLGPKAVRPFAIITMPIEGTVLTPPRWRSVVCVVFCDAPMVSILHEAYRRIFGLEDVHHIALPVMFCPGDPALTARDKEPAVKVCVTEIAKALSRGGVTPLRKISILSRDADVLQMFHQSSCVDGIGKGAAASSKQEQARPLDSHRHHSARGGMAMPSSYSEMQVLCVNILHESFYEGRCATPEKLNWKSHRSVLVKQDLASRALSAHKDALLDIVALQEFSDMYCRDVRDLLVNQYGWSSHSSDDMMDKDVSGGERNYDGGDTCVILWNRSRFTQAKDVFKSVRERSMSFSRFLSRYTSCNALMDVLVDRRCESKLLVVVSARLPPSTTGVDVISDDQRRVMIREMLQWIATVYKRCCCYSGQQQGPTILLCGTFDEQTVRMICGDTTAHGMKWTSVASEVTKVLHDEHLCCHVIIGESCSGERLNIAHSALTPSEDRLIPLLGGVTRGHVNTWKPEKSHFSHVQTLSCTLR